MNRKPVPIGFNTQPPEGGWSCQFLLLPTLAKFQHTAARRRLAKLFLRNRLFFIQFQHTAARRRLGDGIGVFRIHFEFQHTAARRRLVSAKTLTAIQQQFQHTAARRRLDDSTEEKLVLCSVSTHSRPKAAGCWSYRFWPKYHVSTHSRPKAAGTVDFETQTAAHVSTHSRPKAAG